MGKKKNKKIAEAEIRLPYWSLEKTVYSKFTKMYNKYIRNNKKK